MNKQQNGAWTAAFWGDNVTEVITNLKKKNFTLSFFAGMKGIREQLSFRQCQALWNMA